MTEAEFLGMLDNMRRSGVRRTPRKDDDVPAAGRTEQPPERPVEPQAKPAEVEDPEPFEPQV